MNKEALEQGQGGGGAGCSSLGKHLFDARQTPDVVTEVSREERFYEDTDPTPAPPLEGRGVACADIS